MISNFSIFKRNFYDLSEREILALAILAEEEDGRIYRECARYLQADYPKTAQMFVEMADEENEHRQELIKHYKSNFGDEDIPLVRRQDIKGFFDRKPIWFMKNQPLEKFRKLAEDMEIEAQNFYLKAASRTSNPDIRKLLGDLAHAEAGHIRAAQSKAKNLEGEEGKEELHFAKKKFILEIVQPGLAGLIDGSISTIAPIFAAAFATQSSHDTFLVGLAASVGAGISMGFTEALSDDGVISGRGSPWTRGFASGIMTTVGGLGHTLPYLITDITIATIIAAVLVVVELLAIAWIRKKYMETPLTTALYQVVLGGVLVLIAGILIGNA